MAETQFKPYATRGEYQTAERNFVQMLMERIATPEGRNMSDQEATSIFLIWQLLIDIQVIAADM